MVREELVNRICVRRGMKKMSISTNPTWTDKANESNGRFEGIELELGKLKPFWAIDGKRDYNEPTGDRILQTIKLIQVEDIGKKDTEEESKPEIVNETGVTPLPDNFTSANVTDWNKMKTIDRMLLFQRTPKEQIFKKNVGGGKEASYVKGNYMIKEANAAFLFDWSFVQIGINVGDKGVCVYGTLIAMVDGVKMARPAVGYEEINAKMTPQLAIKSATTDAIKKGLSMFGFNSDVYSGEYD